MSNFISQSKGNCLFFKSPNLPKPEQLKGKKVFFLIGNCIMKWRNTFWDSLDGTENAVLLDPTNFDLWKKKDPLRLEVECKMMKLADTIYCHMLREYDGPTTCIELGRAIASDKNVVLDVQKGYTYEHDFDNLFLWSNLPFNKENYFYNQSFKVIMNKISMGQMALEPRDVTSRYTVFTNLFVDQKRSLVRMNKRICGNHYNIIDDEILKEVDFVTKKKRLFFFHNTSDFEPLQLFILGYFLEFDSENVVVYCSSAACKYHEIKQQCAVFGVNITGNAFSCITEFLKREKYVMGADEN
jgi:hypothetical protein